jgi:signal transduction histidine kinase
VRRTRQAGPPRGLDGRSPIHHNQGVIQLQLDRVLLSDVMGQAAEAIRPVIDEAGHTLEVQCPHQDLPLHADGVRLVQILGNLLANATRYTPDGGVIRLAGFADSGRAVVEVSDNGVGIPLDQQAIIFEKFTQLEHPMSDRSRSGLGIGLSLVKELVTLHHGTVTVSSQGPGQGSTFRIEMPLAPSPAVPPTNTPAAGRAATRTAIRAGQAWRR